MTEPTKFTSTDQELPPASIIKDASVGLWTRDYETELGGRRAWHPIDARGNPTGDDPESWSKVAGNYGPVTMLAEVVMKDDARYDGDGGTDSHE